MKKMSVIFAITALALSLFSPSAQAAGLPISLPTTLRSISTECATNVNSLCTFTYSDTQMVGEWSVPLNVSKITVRLVGGTGGRGSDDAPGPGGVPAIAISLTHTLNVTPGQKVYFAPGGGGESQTGAWWMQGRPSAKTSSGGSNPFGQFNGGSSAISGSTSGTGGGGGAATVLQTDNLLLVAGGTGGGGGGSWDIPGSNANSATPQNTDTSNGGPSVTVPYDGGSGGGGGGGLRGGQAGFYGLDRVRAAEAGWNGTSTTGVGVLSNLSSTPSSNGYIEVNYSVDSPNSPSASPSATSTITPSPLPSAAPGKSDGPAVALGDAHSCALLSPQTVRCWGNAWGPAVTQVPSDLGDINSISAGGTHTCVVQKNNIPRCWGGSNWAGGMYAADSLVSTVPPQIGQVKSIAAGGSNNCVIKTDSTLFCWGSDRFGVNSIPSGLGQVKQVEVSGGRYDWNSESACAINFTDNVVCWGSNQYGQTNVPSDLGKVKSIAVGWFSACAITSQDLVRCWGSGSVPFGIIPQVPQDLGKVSAIKVGAYMACAIDLSKTPKCWGQGYAGSQVAPPLGLGNVVNISVGWEHACALQESGQISCWGSGGDANDGRTNVPSDLPSARFDLFQSQNQQIQLPPKPTNLYLTPGDGRITIAFALANESTSTPISNYEYSLDGGSTWSAFNSLQISSPAEITGLQNGRAYSVCLRAINVNGAGLSSECLTGMPMSALNQTLTPPTILRVASFKSSLLVNFNPPLGFSSQGMRYQYSLDGGDWRSGPTTWDQDFGFYQVISNLVRGQSYSVRMRVCNATGCSQPTQSISAAIPLLPETPTIKNVSSYSSSLLLNVNVPSSRVFPTKDVEYSLDGGQTWTSFGYITSPFRIAMAERFSNQSITVRTLNENGYSSPSNTVSMPIQLTVLPDAPTLKSSVTYSSSVVLNIIVPTNRVAPTKAVEYSLDGGETWTAFRYLTSPFRIDGLSRGTQYSVITRTVNQNGVSEASSPETFYIRR